jgi:hypothetical protein
LCITDVITVTFDVITVTLDVITTTLCVTETGGRNIVDDKVDTPKKTLIDRRNVIHVCDIIPVNDVWDPKYPQIILNTRNFR